MNVSDGYGLTEPETDDERERWVCDNDRKAAWHLRRIAEHEAEVARINAVAEADIAAVRQWADDATRPAKSSIDFHRGSLIAYRYRLEDEGTIPATYKLPGGNLVRRKGRDSVKVTDPDAFLDWAEVNETTAVKRSPLVTPLKDGGYEHVDGRVVTADGEVVPGVEVVTGEDTVSVKVTPEPEGPR